ncbi:outer membrane lipoprotein carrier protein LolA [candidate division KSB1 bacterium]|nr:outer membrane lipoprotein carrier protein LolA [candidate division KSB1 bacterium]
MKKLIILLILTSFCFSMNFAYSAMSAKNIVKKVKDTYQDLRTVVIEFEQDFKWKLAGTNQKVNGKIIIKDNVKYHVEIDNNTIVTDGITVWNYSRANNQVIIKNSEKADADQLPSKILLKYAEDYNVTLVGEERLQNTDCYVLLFKSKTGDDYYQQMKAWISKKNWMTSKIEQTDINQNINTYLIRSVQTNTPIDDSNFIFRTPKGVEEIDMRAK